MVKKNHLASISDILTRAAIVGIGLYLGEGIGTTVVAGLGINLSSTILDSGLSKLREKWLSSTDGILNHDIQQALSRAFIKSLNSLEKKYFALEETSVLPQEKKEAIKSLFQELKDEARTVFLPSIEKAVNENEVKSYLYANPQEAQNALWERIDGTNLIYSYYGEHFKNFLRDNCLDEIVFWFGEELKTDSKENNKAWRAFQRMLLEGIQADVKAVKASQDVVKRDLKKLDKIRKQLAEIKDTIDHRLPNEPFQESFAKALTDIKSALHDVVKTTQRTEETSRRIEEKADTISADVKTLLGSKTAPEEPQIPDDIQKLFDEGLKLRYAGKYDEAKALFQSAKKIAISYNHRLAVAEVNRLLAVILNERDRDSDGAIALLNECLKEFRTLKAEKYVARTSLYLGVIGVEDGDIDLSTAYLSQALELAEKHDMKLLVASALHQLGWLEHRRGHSKQALDLYDQSISSFLSLYHNGDIKTEQDAMHGVALCYHHRGLIYEHLGNVEEVEANFMRALDWNRKSEAKSEIAKILWLIANLKFRENEYDEATKFLEEAIVIYSELENYSWLARCLDLKARLHYTLGRPDKAIAIFEIALATVEKNSDYREQVKYLAKLGRIHGEAKNLEKAKNYFEKAKDLSLREDLLESYAGAVENLAKVAHVEKNLKERNRLLLDGIQTLEKLLRSVQIEPRRAFITGRIGFFYERLEDFPQALIYYQRTKKAFETYSDIWGIASSLGSIARIKGFMGKRNEEFDAYSKVKTLVDGTSFYDLIAGSAINLGEINMEIGNLDEAKMLFQEADFLCRKYNLHFADHLSRTINRLNKLISVRKLPELSFEQLLNELFRLVNWFPEAKDSLLRLWFSGRVETLLGNFRSSLGIKFMLCQDDLKTFLETSEVLYAYSDLCLQVVSIEYPSGGMDIVPFPEDEDTFFDWTMPIVYAPDMVAKKSPIDSKFTTPSKPLAKKLDSSAKVAPLSQSFATRYYLTSDTAQSKITGNTGAVFMGWALGLPEQAHELILSKTVADLIKQKIFFLPYSRHLFNDKLHNDLSFFGKEIGLIPVYFDSLPSSENVAVLHSAKINLPILSADDAESQRRQIRKVKHSLTQLLSLTKDSAQLALNNFVFEVDELSDICEKCPSVQIQIYILEFLGALDKELHVAFVIKE